MKIAIAGYGLEGASNYRYYVDKGDVTIVDERDDIRDLPAGTPTILGPNAFSKLADFDMVVRSAGVPPHKITTSGTIWSATNEFFAQCRTDIIGVTGTKGKGTTASLIYSILQAAGKKVVLLGNIGVPALDMLDEAQHADIVIYELSSYQLWDVQKSPQVAVVLMIEADHLDVHADMDEYVNAKANIRRYQGQDGMCFYHPTNPYSRTIAQTDAWAEDAYEHAAFLENAHPYNDQSDRMSVYVKNDSFYIREERICSTDALQLPGAHNIENACAAISAARLYTVNNEAVRRGLEVFTGLDHRLKLVRTVGGKRFYDDSIATTPGSAIAAMKAFVQPKVIILGGSSKGAEFDKLAQTAVQSQVRCAVVIGEEAEQIEACLRSYGVVAINMGTDVSMMDIVVAADRLSRDGDVVIMSPACASFDMFKNYSDRGEQFVTAVNNL